MAVRSNSSTHRVSFAATPSTDVDSSLLAKHKDVDLDVLDQRDANYARNNSEPDIPQEEVSAARVQVTDFNSPGVAVARASPLRASSSSSSFQTGVATGVDSPNPPHSESAVRSPRDTVQQSQRQHTQQELERPRLPSSFMSTSRGQPSAVPSASAVAAVPSHTPSESSHPRTETGLDSIWSASPTQVSPKPSGGDDTAGTSPSTSPARTAFSQTLAKATMRAPERFAEKLLELLQQGCLDETSMGHSSFVWDTPLPGGRRFSDAVARAFAGQLKELGFIRLEWWSGKEWKDMPGRYCIIHDTMYDKYNMRIRVRWPDTADAAQVAGAFQANALRRHNSYAGASSELTDASLAPILQQLQQVLALQQQLLLQSAAGHAAAEARAARAEERAAAAERRSLGSLRARIAGENGVGSPAPAVDGSADNGFPRIGSLLSSTSPIAVDDAQPWSLSRAYSLGSDVGTPDNGEVARLDINEFSCIPAAVEALNRNRVRCNGGMCICYSDDEQVFFLLVRLGHEEEAIRVARETFNIVVHDDRVEI